MRREDVEALLTLATLAGPRRRECAVPSDTLDALCRAWLALDGAAAVALEWGDFNRGLHIEDDRMTPSAWETHLTGQRVRIVRVEE